MSREQNGLSLKVAIVDDHTLFRRGLVTLLNMVGGKSMTILFEASNGNDMMEKIDRQNQPDVLLMDISMPGMDGYESVKWLREHYPLINILVLSMLQKELSIIRMLRLGVKGYLGKDVEPEELGEALKAIYNGEYYYTPNVTGMLIHSINNNGKAGYTPYASLNDRELAFLKLACTELTYNEIASKMYVSPKTIDGYRSALFDKLNVKSRVGLVLYAIKNELVLV